MLGGGRPSSSRFTTLNVAGVFIPNGIDDGLKGWFLVGLAGFMGLSFSHVVDQREMKHAMSLIPGCVKSVMI